MEATRHAVSDPARDALRTATAAAHARLDAGLQHGIRSPRDYGAYLQGMHAFVAQCADALDAADGDVRGPLDDLRADLAGLDLEPLPRRAGARVADPAEALGWRYVLNGASLGARVLLRDAAGLGYAASRGARFLAGHAGGDAWPRYLARLRAAAVPAADHPALCRGALAAFAVAESAMHRARQGVRDAA